MLAQQGGKSCPCLYTVAQETTGTITMAIEDQQNLKWTLNPNVNCYTYSALGNMDIYVQGVSIERHIILCSNSIYMGESTCVCFGLFRLLYI